MKNRIKERIAIILMVVMVFGLSINANAASDTTKEIVKFYVRYDKIEQVETGKTHYATKLYTVGIEGQIKEFKQINSTDSPETYLQDILDNIVGDAPSVEDFTFSGLSKEEQATINNETHTIRWYVLKKEPDNWHIDGILMPKEFEEKEPSKEESPSDEPIEEQEPKEEIIPSTPEPPAEEEVLGEVFVNPIIEEELIEEIPVEEEPGETLEQESEEEVLGVTFEKKPVKTGDTSNSICLLFLMLLMMTVIIKSYIYINK